jgi:drug/metabolite transporter (DMT)-like permease
VDAVVVGLVLLAAVLHVVWNVLLKTAGEPLRTATVGTAAAALVLVPLAAAGWWSLGRPTVPVGVLGVAALSGVVETVYFVLLASAYRRGDLSTVYPTARGTAPLLAVVVGVVVLGERLGPVGSVGVVALLAGILILQRPWRGLRASADPRTRAATLLALGAGVCIALYSALDRVGVRETEPWLYAALIWAAMAGGLVGVTLLGVRTGALAPGGLTAGVDRRAAALGGLLTLAAYGLVLLAFTVAPLTAVAPLRESAVVLASGWGVLRLGEAIDRQDATRRIVASGLVVLGIVLLVVD